MFAAVGAQAPYFVLAYRERGLELSTIGLVVGVGAIVGLLSSAAWGALSDRLRGDPRAILGPASVAIAGALLLWSLPRRSSVDPAGVLAIGVAVVLISAGIAGVAPIVEARGLETSGHDRSGYGPLRAVGSIAFIAATIPIGALVDRFGPTVAVATYVGLILVTGLVGLTLKPPARRDDAVGSAPPPGLREILRLLAAPRLGLFLLGAGLAWVSLSTVVGFYALRFSELGGSPSAAGFAFSLGAAVEVPVMVGFPRFARRLGAERLLVVGALGFATRAFVAGTATSPVALIFVSAIGGMAFALTLVGGVTFVSRLAPPDLQATAQGVFQGSTTSFGSITAGVLTAAIGAMGVNVGGLFVVVAAVGVAAAAIFVLVLVEGRRHVP
jgi:PPP family 3-phenylpropionic acid transporter